MLFFQYQYFLSSLGFSTTTLDVIPVVHLDFDEIKDTQIPDVSGHHNDAHYRPPVDILAFSKSCERGLRLNGGDVFFDGEFFIDKPREEITVAAWVKLFSNGGQHSIFDTVGGKDSAHREGQYHFEVDRGRLRWFHRNEAKDNVFNISSPLMIPAHVWTHCAATYSSISGKVAVFVNGKLGAQVNFQIKHPLLNQKKTVPGYSSRFWLLKLKILLLFRVMQKK